MRRLLLALLILPLAGCSTLSAFLSTPVSPLPNIEVLLPPAYSTPAALAPTLTPVIPTNVVTPTLAEPSATQGPSWSLSWQASEQDFPAEHYSLAITRPHVEPESPESAWINREIDRIVDADIASFREMAAQGILDEEFPGHLWIGFSVPSAEVAESDGDTGITESDESAENTETPEGGEGVEAGSMPPVPRVVGVAQGQAPAGEHRGTSLPDPLPASQALLDLGRPVLSLLMGVSPYTGGAHPGFYHVPLTLDFTTQAPLELADLFLPGSDYLGRLSQLAIQQLAGREGIFPETLQLTPAPDGQGFPSGAGPHPDNYRVWALSPQGLWVVFDPYQVAPWAAGSQFVLIPYAELADLLDPSGPLGRVASGGG